MRRDARGKGGYIVIQRLGIAAQVRPGGLGDRRPRDGIRCDNARVMDKCRIFGRIPDARAYDAQAVTLDIRNRQRGDLGPAKGRQQLAALDPRQPAPHGVDLVNVRARGQLGLGPLCQILQRQVTFQHLGQRRCTARHQHQQMRIRFTALHRVPQRLTGDQAGGVGHGMRGLDHLRVGRCPICVAVLGDDQHRGVGKQRCRRAGHCGGGLAHGDDAVGRCDGLRAQRLAHAGVATDGIHADMPKV